VPHNYTGALQIDPIEKKPFFHVLPSSKTLSFGMLGCDYHCRYCQNWITSQALRDPRIEAEAIVLKKCTAEDLVHQARQCQCDVITSTFNEPLITSEWAIEIFKIAHQNHLITSYVSNGNATPEVLRFIRPWVDLYKVDLKSFNDQTYRKLIGGTLKPVLNSIIDLKQLGFWVELVTLLIPGINDQDSELKSMAQFIVSVDRNIPWHLTAFHPDYEMTETSPTLFTQLARGVEIGKAAGLRYVYSGNRPTHAGLTENTYCHQCQTLLIERKGFQVLNNYLPESGLCPHCSTCIPGIWKKIC
jgi:pyruvate formate lyase activating enzyme